jgi:poly(3-hydroxybutyrate) depolymerase
MYKTLTWLPWFAIAFTSYSCLSSKFVTGFQARSITLDGREHRFAIYLPPNYDPQYRWPLLVFLNGRGECGTDGEKHLKVGLAPAIHAEPERWPFVVVLPQKPRSETWWTDHEDLVMATTTAVEQEFSIDPQKRLLTGLSQGGHGTWAIGAKNPHMWAAIAPVCGFRIGEVTVKALRSTPVWAFHGMADPIVSAQQSQQLVAELEAAGGKPILTLYDGVGHNSWDMAYRHSGLAEWLSLVTEDRLGATYLADPNQLTEAELDIEMYTPGKTRSHKITVHAKDCWIRIYMLSGDDEPHMKTISDTSGLDWRHTGKWANDLVYDPLRRLVRTGLLHQSTLSSDQSTEGPQVRVALSLLGPEGTWRFQRSETNSPQHDRRWASYIECIAAAMRQTTAR